MFNEFRPKFDLKIAFITGSLERGRDGVGDYTRRLAGELIRQGHPSILLGLNDSFVSDQQLERQIVEGVPITMLRLPSFMPWHMRVNIARQFLEDFNPDWVSLQFVPFGFHLKGLPFGLPRHLRSIIGSRPLHWMFHELWVLWCFPLSLRRRFLGQFQKHCLLSSLRQLRPKAVSTQLLFYQAELEKYGVSADVIPLHGNIPLYDKSEADRWFSGRCASINTRLVKVGFFGNILSTLDTRLFKKRMIELSASGKGLLVLSAGKIGAENAMLWNSLERQFRTVATFVKLGELSEREASFYFSSLDYGLTSYSPELMGKSGSVAAMREHGLTVIACGSLHKDVAEDEVQASQIKKAEQSWTVKHSAVCLLQQLQTGRP